ncbi:hypothetical protein EVAR_52029_1 [Eumeta japonica]|uniref:Uncharacterized protein n=1 Tax=Eumeta variegata TaxID=151549 RepID=A0A4C1YSW9_EUMVA|nr:hypothetical protein EVAR_52029_1 [Eumeta japonica]
MRIKIRSGIGATQFGIKSGSQTRRANETARRVGTRSVIEKMDGLYSSWKTGKSELCARRVRPRATHNRARARPAIERSLSIEKSLKLSSPHVSKLSLSHYAASPGRTLIVTTRYFLSLWIRPGGHIAIVY